MTTNYKLYQITCAASDSMGASKILYTDNLATANRQAGQMRRYYTSVRIRQFAGVDKMTNYPCWL